MAETSILDPERLQEIFDLDLTSSELDEQIQQLLEELAAEMNLPIALVSIVLGEAQYFLGMHGLDGWLKEVRGTPLEWSFCKNIVLSDKAFVVEDASEHHAVKDNPLVTLEGIRCYAGVPLRTSNGHVLGSLCVIGDQDRTFQAQELTRLEELATAVIQTLEARRSARS